MLHNYEAIDGCGSPSSIRVNRSTSSFLDGSCRINSSGDFDSLQSSTNSLWRPYADQADVMPGSMPDYPSDDEMASQVKRLQTFRNWPSSCPVKPKELAAAGFYYAGIGDNARCFRCDLTLRKWEPGDNPWEDHKKCKPNCPYVRENTSANRYEVPYTGAEASSSNVQSSPYQVSQSTFDVSFGNVTSEEDRERPSSSSNPQENLQNQFSYQKPEGQESSDDDLRATFHSGVRNPGLYGFQQQMHSMPHENEEVPSYTRQEAAFILSSSLKSLQGKEGIKAVVSQSAPSSLPAEQTKPKEEGTTTRLIHCGGMVFQLNPENQVSIMSGGQGAALVTSCNTEELRPRYTQGQATQLEVQGLHAGQSSMCPAEVNPFIHSASLKVKTGNPCYPVQSGKMGRETKPSRYHEPGSHVPPIGRERPKQMANVAYPVVDPTLEEGRQPLMRPEDVHHVVAAADLASEHHRLTTFVDWPQDSPVRPWELSVAGFYFVGTGDSVKCFMCGVSLTNWEPDDTPWNEHIKWSPQCPLVLRHFHGRAQMGPVETTAGVPQSHQPYSQFQPTLPQSLIRRRSQPVRSVVPGRSFSEPRMLHTTSSSRPMTYRTAEVLGYPSLGTNTHSGAGSLPCQEVRHSDVPQSVPPATMSPSTPTCAPGITSSDVEHLVNMGFEREHVRQVIWRRITSGENNFSSLNELLQAVLSCNSQTCTRVTSAQSTTAHEPSLSHFSVQSTLPALPLENEELPSAGPASAPTSPSPGIEGLHRTISAPVDSLSGGSQVEKDEDLQQKLDRMQEERTCKVCMDAEVGVVFLPCGHLSCCPTCASGMALCPMCRSPIQEKIRTYLS